MRLTFPQTPMKVKFLNLFRKKTLMNNTDTTTILIIIAMMPLNHILRKCTTGYKIGKSKENINHLMYMDDIKLLAKMRKNWKLKYVH